MSQQPPNTEQYQWGTQQSSNGQQPQWPVQPPPNPQAQWATQQPQWTAQQPPSTQQSQWPVQQPPNSQSLWSFQQPQPTQQPQWPEQQSPYAQQTQWVPLQSPYGQQSQWESQPPPYAQQPQWSWQDQPQSGQFQPQPPAPYGSPQSKQNGKKPWYKNRGVIIGLLCSILVVVLVLGYVGYGVSTLLGHKSAATPVVTPTPLDQSTTPGLTATPSLAPTATPTHAASPTTTPTVVAAVPTSATTPTPMPVPTHAATPTPIPTPKLQPTTVQVSITNSGFTPAGITIAVGSTVVWTNNGGIPHTATDSGKFDSGELIVGATYKYTFTAPGVYNYVCSYHPYMVGTITVQ